MGLSKEERERRAKYKAVMDELKNKEAARKREAETQNTILVETHAKNAREVSEQIERLGELGRKRIQEGIRGYETPVTVYNSMDPGYRAFEALSRAVMIYVGSKLFLWPMNRIGRLTRHVGEDLLASIKSSFVDTTPPYQIPKVQFFVDMKDDDTLDLKAIESQVKYAGKTKLTRAERISYTNTFADWIESTQGGKYKVYNVDPNDDSKGFEVYEKPPAGSPDGTRGAKVTQEQFRELRDDPSHGFSEFLIHKFGPGFEQLTEPPPSPSYGP